MLRAAGGADVGCSGARHAREPEGVKGARARLWLRAEPTPSRPPWLQSRLSRDLEKGPMHHLPSGELQDAAAAGDLMSAVRARTAV